jgi:hypothetical protein
VVTSNSCQVCERIRAGGLERADIIARSRDRNGGAIQLNRERTAMRGREPAATAARGAAPSVAEDGIDDERCTNRTEGCPSRRKSRYGRLRAEHVMTPFSPESGRTPQGTASPFLQTEDRGHG